MRVMDYIEDTYGPILEMVPIGNHELKRHEVHKLVTKDQSFVLKTYYKPNRWNREVAVLKTLRDKLPVARIIDYGKLDQEYLLMSYEGGQIFKDMTQVDKAVIYEEMGVYLAQIHTIPYDFFGSMTEDNDPIQGFTTMKAYLQETYEKIKKELLDQTHESQVLIDQAVLAFEEALAHMPIIEDARLCHNDFGPRNILVQAGHVACILDFEQSIPSDPDKEWIGVVQDIAFKDPNCLTAFERGYRRIRCRDDEALARKEKLYTLYHGLAICSWAQKLAKDYYDYGIKLLRIALDMEA